MLPRKGIDGLIVVPLAQTKENLLKHFPSDIPLALLDRPLSGIDASVSSDQEQGARMLCDALATVGVKRVGLISGPEHAITHRLRAQHIAEHFKIAARQDGTTEMETGMEAYDTFKSHRLDAVVGTNSTLAQGYLRAMKSPDLKAAEKRLVVGCFDDIHMKNLMTIPIVCAVQDLRGMAAGIVKQLIPQLQHQTSKPEPILLPMHLESNQAFKERQSTNPVAA
jgi:DNA-binding LacI/PurR family transcriptional regulator